MTCRYCHKGIYSLTEIIDQESENDVFKQRVHYFCPVCQATDSVTEFYRLEVEEWDEIVPDFEPDMKSME